MEIVKGDIIVRYMTEVEKETLWMLHDEIIIVNSVDEIVVIPKYFVTDFASVPKIFWSLISPIGHYNMAALIHDYYYTYKPKTRFFADVEFLRWMNLVTPQTRIRNYIMYVAVRLFGQRRYKANYL